MKINDLLAFFKTVEFFKNCNWDDDIVFLEVIETRTVVKDYVGIEDKDFTYSASSAA